MTNITYTRMGGRIIELFCPFMFDGKQIDRISFGPPVLDTTLRWNAGEFKGVLELMVEMSGESEALLRQLRYPDADRVQEAFITMLPNEIRDAVVQGVVPGVTARNTEPELPTYNMPSYAEPPTESPPPLPPSNGSMPPPAAPGQAGFGLDLDH